MRMRHEWVKRHNTKSFGPCWWALASRYLPLTTCHLKHVEPCDRQRLWSDAHTQTRTYRRAPLSRKFGNSPVIRLKVQWSSHLQDVPERGLPHLKCARGAQCHAICYSYEWPPYTLFPLFTDKGTVELLVSCVSSAAQAEEPSANGHDRDTL